MPEPPRIVQINTTAIPVAGVGGVGMLALAAIIAAVFTEARWLLFIGVAGGVIFAGSLVALRRRRGPSKPTHIT